MSFVLEDEQDKLSALILSDNNFMTQQQTQWRHWFSLWDVKIAECFKEFNEQSKKKKFGTQKKIKAFELILNLSFWKARKSGKFQSSIK